VSRNQIESQRRETPIVVCGLGASSRGYSEILREGGYARVIYFEHLCEVANHIRRLYEAGYLGEEDDIKLVIGATTLYLDHEYGNRDGKDEDIKALREVMRDPILNTLVHHQHYGMEDELEACRELGFVHTISSLAVDKEGIIMDVDKEDIIRAVDGLGLDPIRTLITPYQLPLSLVSESKS